MGNQERVLSRIQKYHNLNEVVSVGDTGPGGAYHNYRVYHGILSHGDDNVTTTEITFQNGPRKITSSVCGVIDTDLLEIVRDRLIAFQNGAYACDENAHALVHLEEALLWMNARVESRASRDVLGTTKI